MFTQQLIEMEQFDWFLSVRIRVSITLDVTQQTRLFSIFQAIKLMYKTNRFRLAVRIRILQ